MSGRPLAFAFAALLVAVGAALGTWLDESPPRPEVRRAGLRVLEADFHAHTRFSDGLLSPFGLVLQARRRSLDAFAITEHNGVFPAKMGRWFTGVVGGPTVIVGEEVTTSRFHLIALGVERSVDPNQPVGGVIDVIHGQGGLAVAAHPVGAFWPSLVPVRHRLDASEVMHPLALRGGRGRDDWRWEQMRDFYLQGREGGARLTAIGASDYHFFSVLGIVRTLVFAERNDAPAILDALRAGKTVVFDTTGRAYGDAALIAALEREPYELRPQDYGYEGSGSLDRFGRAAGLLGLVGLVLLRPRRWPKGKEPNARDRSAAQELVLP